MEEIVGHVNNIRFDIEVALEDQLGVQNLPFPGMDSKLFVQPKFGPKHKPR